jgi:hypothetical protein
MLMAILYLTAPWKERLSVAIALFVPDGAHD